MYIVGQILYTVYQDRYKIVPLKVVEQLIRKSIDGETTEYFVQIPSKKQENIVNLKKVNNVFTSLEEVESYLMKNAKDSINNIVEEAKKLQEEYFDGFNNSPNKEENNIKLDFIPPESQSNPVVEEKVNIDLGDGVVGKLNMESVKKALGEDIVNQ
jgi:hypothetical protein